jgi:ABC-type amino acid transport substrate-binding protein
MRHFFAFVVMACAFNAHAQTLEKIKQSGVITLAFRESSPPFSYMDANKQPLGFSVELCKRVVESLRTELKLPKLESKWLPVSAAERIPTIRDNKADIECGNTTNTPDRRKDVAFAIPTFIAGIAVMSPAKAPVADLNALSGRKVAVPAGSTALKLLTAHNERYSAGITLISPKDNAEAMKLLESAQVDAWMTDDTLLFSFRASAKEPIAWSVSGKRFSVEPLALMYRKDDAAFADKVNKEVRRLMLSGEFSALYARWFTQTIPEKNINLNIEIGSMLRSFISHPTAELPVNY